jgi:outer membrane protein TolC
MSATETEYLDAQDDLTQAELDLALARTRVRLAEAALLWALGR